MEPEVGVEQKYKQFFFFLKQQINSHLIHHQKKKTQNYWFLRYYNAIIYENGTHRLKLLHPIDKNYAHKHSTTNQ